jgi:hypothetical protein
MAIGGKEGEEGEREEVKLARDIADRAFRQQLEIDLKHAPAGFVNALDMLNPEIHSIGVLELLHLIKDTEDLTPQFHHHSKIFLESCNARQVQLMPERFTDVVMKFVSVHLKQRNSPLSAVGPLLCAVTAFRKSPEHLSGVSHEFVRVCLLAKCYHIAARVLDTDVIYLPELNGSEGKVPEIKMENLLLYFYYGGMVYVGLHQFERALQFFSVAITVPAECTSQIMLESYKKYLLVCLLLYGNEVHGARFRQKFTLDDAIGSHACSLEARRRVTNGIPLGCSLLLLAHTVNCVQTLKAVAFVRIGADPAVQESSAGVHGRG